MIRRRAVPGPPLAGSTASIRQPPLSVPRPRLRPWRPAATVDPRPAGAQSAGSHTRHPCGPAPAYVEVRKAGARIARGSTGAGAETGRADPRTYRVVRRIVRARLGRSVGLPGKPILSSIRPRTPTDRVVAK